MLYSDILKSYTITCEGVSEGLLNVVIDDIDNFLSDNKNRFMTIYKKPGKEIACNLLIDLSRTRPLFQTPKEVIKSKEMVNIDLVKGKHSTNFGFKTDIPSLNFNSLILKEENLVGDWVNKIPQEKVKEIVTSVQTKVEEALKADSKKSSSDRYIELFSFTNPLTQSDYTLFLDRLFNDLFMVSGLGLLLDSNQSITTDRVIPVSGYKIGGYQDIDYNKPVYDYIATIDDSEFVINGAISDVSEFTIGEDIFCKAVTFTRDLPSNLANTNYPVFYDKLTHINGSEIQLARQDTIPNLWINIGKLSNYIEESVRATSKNNIPNYIIYNSNPNIYRFFSNGFKHEDTTEFGFIVPIY